MRALPLIVLVFVAGAAMAQDFAITTTVADGGYFPGEDAVLRTTIAKLDEQTVTAFRVRVTLPFGWSYLGDDLGQEVLTEESGANIDHVWILPPIFPVTLEWAVSAPETAVGPIAIPITVVYRFQIGSELRQETTATLFPTTVPPGLQDIRQDLLLNFATADTDGSGTITAEEAAAYDADIDAETFAALDVNGDNVVDELELSVNVLAGLDCGCPAQDDGDAKRSLGDLLLLSALMGAVTATGAFTRRT